MRNSVGLDITCGPGASEARNKSVYHSVRCSFRRPTRPRARVPPRRRPDPGVRSWFVWRLRGARAAGPCHASCSVVLPRQYEYEEEIYLALDGTATVYVNGSVPALVALRGLPLDVKPRAPVDRAAVRALYTSP